MSRPDFVELCNALWRAGVAPGETNRLIEELESHYDDLVAEAMDKGQAQEIAELEANAALGDMQSIANAAGSVPELRSWAWRWPKLALVFYPVACIAILPAVPVRAGIEHVSEIARWTACIAFGAFITAIMFLALQLSITLT